MPRRPATRTTPSPSAYVTKKHKKAQQLEEQLKDKAADSSAGNRLRVPLCETLSDLLITDPAFSRQQGVIDRLWKHCFYSRIRFLRGQVIKLQRRQQPTDRVQATLQDFLIESVALYQYLIDKLESQLLQAHGRSSATTASSSSGSAALHQRQQQQDDSTAWTEDSSAAPPPAADSTVGVVDCLHRLYVQLGDLFRYSENFSKAQTAYQRAAWLGPGLGHAMNQLAVAVSNKDAAGQRAVALYWYARSLAVTTVPFATARANLVKLLENNQTWLQEQAPTMAEVVQGGGSSSSSINSNNKSLQSRRFLSHYCQLHGAFFEGLTLDMLTNNKSSSSPVQEQIQKCRETLRQLLQMQALGDGLLCKLVTIQAFSECFLDHSGATPENRKEMVQTTGMVARTLTLQLGSEMAQRILSSKSQQGKNASYRLLLPLLLVMEYVWTRPFPSFEDEKWSAVKETHDEAARDFWSQVVHVWNHFKAQQQEQVDTGDEILKEYQNLRGFAPFSSFLPKIEDDGMLLDEEAVAVLTAATANKKSNRNQHESASTTTTGTSTMSTNADQNRLKVARLLCLGKEWAAAEDQNVGGGTIVWDGEKYDYVLPGTTHDEDMAHEPTDDDVVMASSPQGDQESSAAPSLIYQQAEGGGPALLVPSMFLTTQQPASTASTPMDEVVENKTPTVMENPVATATDLPSRGNTPLGGNTTPNGPPELGAAQPIERAAVLPPPGFSGMPSPPAPAGPPPGLFPTEQQSTTVPEGTSTSFDLFGGITGLQTANPFADTYQNQHGNNLIYTGDDSTTTPANGASLDIFSSFHQQDNVTVDGTSLLDSGLLSSILMDDPPKPTKNPFAT